MLTGDLVRPRLRMTASSLSVELVNEHDPGLQKTASDLIALFRRHSGLPRHTWEKALDAFIGTRIDYIVIRGLAKVLTDAAAFTPNSSPYPPAILREHVFAQGPAFRTPDMFHPRSRQEVLEQLTPTLHLSVEEITALLYADRQSNYLLSDAGPTWSEEALLARYNLELTRGVLYWASHMTIEATSHYKDLWHFMKLFKLMFVAERTSVGGFRIDLDGPISPFVSSTLRYGRQFAAFLPALLLCEQWQMQAQVHPPQAQGSLTYHLDHTCRLHTYFKGAGAFDSRLEADFAQEFEQKFGGKRGHWLLSREDEVLILGDTVMIPDFALTHKKHGYRILIELVGFWHPDYLRRKIEKVRAANCPNLLLLVYKGLNVAEEDFQESAGEVIFFQQKPVLKEVMETVEKMSKNIWESPLP